MREAGFRARAAIAYALLACVYLLYLPHAQFVLDDWFVLGRYETARQAGELGRTALQIVQNQFHGQFRFQWLSFMLGFLLWLAAGWSPKVFLGASLALHWGNAVALRAALRKMGFGEGTAFLAGALFVILPTTHGALLWSFNCTFFLWSTLWFLLYLRELAARGAAWRQVLYLLLALFSGDPVFGLLLAAPVAVWRGWRPAALNWGTVGAAAAAYALLVNRAPVFEAGLNARYRFALSQAWGEGAWILGNVYPKLTGLTAGPYYQLPGSAWGVAWALGAAAVVAWRLRAAMDPVAEGFRAGKAAASAGLLWAAAYGPILFLLAHEFRYDYVPSPWLALGLAAAAGVWGRGRAAAGAALAGWLAMATVADIEQSWIPQSRRLRALEGKLRALGVQPGDTIVVDGTAAWIGTAPHFAFLAGWASTPFAEHVTGVKGLETACEIVEERGGLRLRHRNYAREWSPDEASRTHVLAVKDEAEPEQKRLLAIAQGEAAWRVYALRGYAGPPPPAEPLRRDSLAMLEPEIYFVRREQDGHRPARLSY